MKPVELAKKLGIQLWTPVYRKGKGVAMKQTDDGAYVHLGDLPALTSTQPNNEQRYRGELRWIGQQDDDGCAVASFAMLTGCTYAQAKTQHGLATGGWRHGELRRRLEEAGFYCCAVISREQTGNVWPPPPFAPAHFAVVHQNDTHTAHVVVVDHTGAVLDPLREGRYSLSDWNVVQELVGVVSPVDPNPLTHAGPPRLPEFTWAIPTPSEQRYREVLDRPPGPFDRERFTIAICPECGGRSLQTHEQREHGGTYCYCKTNKGDPTRCEEIEVLALAALDALKEETP